MLRRGASLPDRLRLGTDEVAAELEAQSCMEAAQSQRSGVGDEDGRMGPSPMLRRDACLPDRLGLGIDEMTASVEAHGYMGAARSRRPALGTRVEVQNQLEAVCSRQRVWSTLQEVCCWMEATQVSQGAAQS